MSKQEKSCSKCVALQKRLADTESKIAGLKSELIKQEIVLKDNGLLEEVAEISDTEAICIEQLKKIKEISVYEVLSAEKAKVLDTLHMNLLRARGGKLDKTSNKKTKKLSDKELLKLVE